MRLATIAVVLAASVPHVAGSQTPGWGTWDFTLQVLPALKVYESELTLTFTLAGFEIESESTFYHDGLRYQSFYTSGKLGEVEIWGRVSFHARDILYRKAWANLETKIGSGTALLNASHWSASAEYTSADKDKFGPWPCVDAISWDEAWRHIGRTLSVHGPVVSYRHAIHLWLYLGRDSPSPERFEIYIASTNLPGFESAFGTRFWERWAGKTVCAKGGIREWRYAGPPGHSVAQISLSSPANLLVGLCCGVEPPTSCPGEFIRWYEARGHLGHTRHVQGNVASVTHNVIVGGERYTRIRVGGGATVAERVEVYVPTALVPTFEARLGRTLGSLTDDTVCVRGLLYLSGGVARIDLVDPAELGVGPCCRAELARELSILRGRISFSPWSLTVDFPDCCRGGTLGRLTVGLLGWSPCCGVTMDASFSFTQCRGVEGLDLALRNVSLGCCGLTATIELRFTPDAKTVTLTPHWRGGSGCLAVYGDVRWEGTTLAGIAVYGWGIRCSFGRVRLRLLTALDPDKVEDMTDVTFYADEFEYLGLTYTGPGCCTGTATFSTELWFGSKGKLFGLQRVRLKLEVPLTPAVEMFAKGQWNFAKAEPLEWLDVGWRISF